MRYVKKVNWLGITWQRSEVVIAVLLLAILFIGSLLHAINWFVTGYTGINYLVKSPQRYYFPVMMLLWWAAKRWHEHSPRLSSLTWFYSGYFLVYTGLGFLVNSVQYTPFQPIDTWLIQFDQMLGFSTPQALEVGHSSPLIYDSLYLAYNSLMGQLIIVPSVVFFCRGQTPVIDNYFKQLLICGLIGMLIYYFLPTVGPAHYFDSAYFSAQEHNTFLKFYEVHHDLPVLSPTGGIIAFPSFHVIWALLVTWVARSLKWLLYPLVVINVLLVLATLLLGWHYLVDVIASFVLVAVAIRLTK